jgi:anti-sigma regulatory factor (Ser/Thr protein kinase)
MVERRFPRAMASLEAIYGFLREFLAGNGIGMDATFELDLVAEELFTNMVKYGRGGSSEIQMGLEWSAPNLTLRLVDSGVDRFDPTEAPIVDPNRPISERKAGGLGIHLVRRIADRFEYSYEDRTATITITKRLHA